MFRKLSCVVPFCLIAACTTGDAVNDQPYVTETMDGSPAFLVTCAKPHLLRYRLVSSFNSDKSVGILEGKAVYGEAPFWKVSAKKVSDTTSDVAVRTTYTPAGVANGDFPLKVFRACSEQVANR